MLIATNRKINKKYNNKGFSLIEIIIVCAVIAILTSVLVPSFKSIINEVQRMVCDINCLQLEEMYETSLILKNTKHSEAVFIRYMQKYGQDTCPGGGDIIYQDGKVKCIVHSEDGGSGSDNGGNVPFL